jgi:hypothetical protein
MRGTCFSGAPMIRDGSPRQAHSRGSELHGHAFETSPRGALSRRCMHEPSRITERALKHSRASLVVEAKDGRRRPSDVRHRQRYLRKLGVRKRTNSVDSEREQQRVLPRYRGRRQRGRSGRDHRQVQRHQPIAATSQDWQTSPAAALIGASRCIGSGVARPPIRRTAQMARRIVCHWAIFREVRPLDHAGHDSGGGARSGKPIPTALQSRSTAC